MAMNYSDYVIYVDESGDHSLTSIDADFPVFALDFCIFDKKQYCTSVSSEVQDFKFRHFGHDAVILHEHTIRKQKPPFTFLQNREKRTAFMDELSAIIHNAPFTIIAAVIDKQRHRAQYADPMDPYSIALLFCMERTYAFMRDHGQSDRLTHIVFEKRGSREDQQLELVFRRICDGHNYLGPMPCFDIVFVDKKANSAGLQLADLTARPIALNVLRPEQDNRAFDVIDSKIRRSPGGKKQGWGLKVFP
jgi:hypothetical protein